MAKNHSRTASEWLRRTEHYPRSNRTFSGYFSGGANSLYSHSGLIWPVTILNYAFVSMNLLDKKPFF